MPTTYPLPVSARLEEAEQLIVKKIQAKLSRPGLAISMSDAIKIALHTWNEQNPDSTSSKENNLSEN